MLKNKAKMGFRVIGWLLCSTFLLSVELVLGQQEKILLEDIWASSKYRVESVYGIRSMKDGVHYTSLDRDRGAQVINKYKYSSGEVVEAIVQSQLLQHPVTNKPLNIQDYAFSADEKLVLLATEKEAIYRHSSKANFFIYNTESEELKALESNEKQSYASFSPDGRHIAYVQMNNLFIHNLADGTTYAVTNDGEKNKIINGATDWVYEEEFGFEIGFEWSPDSRKIAFYRFDETDVQEFTMPLYNDLYPELYNFKYPKAGEKNAKVEVFMHTLDNMKNAKLSPLTDYEYIPRIKWASAENLVVFTMNRLQNHLQLFLCNGKDEPKLFYEEKANTYINIHDDFIFLKSGNEMVFTSEKSGFNHLHYLNFKDVGRVKETQISKGNWEVTSLYGFDEPSKTAYFQAAVNHPSEREVYKCDLKGKLSPLASKKGTNSAYFSEGYKYFINFYSSVAQPPHITLHSNNGNEVRVLKNNENLLKTIENTLLGKTSFFDLKLSDSLSLSAWQILPPNFDENKLYPVFMYVYGGPGSQTVKNQWGGSNFLWFQHLAQQGYIVISVDNRGTGARGKKFRDCTYADLGKLEIADQIAAAGVIGNLPYVDKERIGIFGWSFGGYMTLLALTKGSEVFKSGVAVAPVTNWRYYDSIYTERYLKTPQENPAGYDDNSPVNHTAFLKDHSLLMIHGSADDNVHLQNAMVMTESMVQNNKQFEQFIYTDKNHGIYGGMTRLHLYQKMTDFILRTL